MPEETLDPNEPLLMTHPEVHTSDDIEPAPTIRAAYEQVWEPKGWQLVDSATPAKTTKKATRATKATKATKKAAPTGDANTSTQGDN